MVFVILKLVDIFVVFGTSSTFAIIRIKSFKMISIPTSTGVASEKSLATKFKKKIKTNI